MFFIFKNNDTIAINHYSRFKEKNSMRFSNLPERLQRKYQIPK